MPANDPFNPCVDIIDSNVLRVGIWAVIIFSIGGNVLVITVTSFYFISRFIKHRKKPQLMYYLYLNLAFADLFMGIYQLTIAIVDLDTIGEYSLHAINWQTGPGCRFAGFCAVLSSLLSVFTLLVITLERVYTIKFAIQHKRLKKRYVAMIVLVGWIVTIILAVLPMFGVSDYGRVSICLPFETRDPIDKVYIAFLLIITGIATFIITLSYVFLFYLVSCSRLRRNLHGSLTGREEMKLALRMSLLVVSDFACWAPIAFFGLTAVFDAPLIGVKEANILIIFVLPINSCLNPILYSLSTRKFRHILISMFKRCGLKKRTEHFNQSSTTKSTSKDTEETERYNKGRRNTEISLISRFSGSRRGSTYSSESGEEKGSYYKESSPLPMRHERISQTSIASDGSVESDSSDGGSGSMSRTMRDRRASLASLSGHVNQLTVLPEEEEEIEMTETKHHSNRSSANSTDDIELHYKVADTGLIVENAYKLDESDDIEIGRNKLVDDSDISSFDEEDIAGTGDILELKAEVYGNAFANGYYVNNVLEEGMIATFVNEKDGTEWQQQDVSFN
jgi:hypothetical protein